MDDDKSKDGNIENEVDETSSDTASVEENENEVDETEDQEVEDTEDADDETEDDESEDEDEGNEGNKKKVSSTVPKDLYIEERRRAQELEAKLREYESSKQPTQQKELTEEEKRQQQADELAIQRLKQIAKKAGILTQEDIEEQREQQAFNQEVEALEKEYDGKNGMPKFSRAEMQKIIDYGTKHKIFNVRVAFEHMNREKIYSGMTSRKKSPVNAPTNTGTSQKGSKISREEMDKMSHDELVEAYKKGLIR